MSTDLDEEGSVSLTRTAITCQRCGDKARPGVQVTSDTGYVQLCRRCVAVLAAIVTLDLDKDI